jgi:hypothetical protein
MLPVEPVIGVVVLSFFHQPLQMLIKYKQAQVQDALG